MDKHLPDATPLNEIEDFFNAYRQAAWNKDQAAMIGLYAENAVIFDMWDQGYCLQSSEWNKSIEEWLLSLGEEKVQVDFEMITINQSPETGFASAVIRFQAISNDGRVLRSMRNRITLGFSKSGAGWKVVHQHTSAPVGSGDLRAILDI